MMKKELNNISKQERSIKRHIFSAHRHTIEHNIVGNSLYFIFLLIEFLQLHFLPFAYPQESNTTYGYITIFFKIVSYVPYILEYAGHNVFTVIWVIHALLLFCVLGLSLYLILGYQSADAKLSFIRKAAYQVRSLLLALFKTVLTFPAAIVFSVPIFCTHDYECWAGASMVTSVLSVFCLFVHFGLSLVITLYVDSHIRSGLPWAGPDTKSHAIFLLLKYSFGVYIAYDYDFSVGGLVYPMIMVATGYVLYKNHLGKHLHNRVIHCVEYLKYAVLFWTLCGMYLCWLVQMYGTFEIGLATWLTSVLISIALYIRQQQKTVWALERDILALGDENVVVNAMAMLIDYPLKINKDPQATWILIGLLNLHRSRCLNDSCPCRTIDGRQAGEFEEEGLLGQRRSSGKGLYKSPYSNARSGSRMSRILQSRIELETQSQNEQQKWRAFLAVFFDDVVAAFPRSVDARLFVAYYQELTTKVLYKAMFQIWKIQEEECSYGQQLAVYKMKSLLNRDICAHENAQSSISIDLDLNIYVRFESKRRELEWKMQDCTQKVMQFWGLLLSVNLKIDKMYSLGGQISCGLQEVHKIFGDIIKIFPDHIKTYINYAKFLREVANNDIEADEYQEKADQITRNLDLTKSQAYSENSIFSINRETAIVIISGNTNTLDTILHANEYMQEIFGYSYSNLTGYSIQRIMPKIVAAAHGKFVKSFHDSGNPGIINKEVLVFGQSKNGLLIPLAALVKSMPGVDDGMKYIGFLRRDLNYIKRNLIKLPYQYQNSKKIGFMMTDIKGNLIAISDKVANVLGIPLIYFERKNALFTEVFNVSEFSHKLTEVEYEEDLKKGAVVELNLKQIIKMVDRDFLTSEEVAALESQTKATVYMQLLKYEHKFGVKYNIYVMVPILMETMGLLQENLKEGDGETNDMEMEIVDALGESMSSTTSTVNDKLRPLYKELKKNTLERHESGQITLVKRIIYCSLLLLLVVSVIDIVYYTLRLNKIRKLFKLMDSSHYRRNYIQTMIEQFQSYRDVAIGREAVISDYEANRQEQLKADIAESLEAIKANEYAFQGRIENLNIEGVTEICCSPGVAYSDIFIDSTVGTSVQGLGITIIQLVSKTNRIINEVPISSLDTPFIRSIYNQTLTTTFKLNQAEKDLYFVLINGLYNILNASSDIIDSIASAYNNTADNEKMLFFILHVVRWSIYLIAVLAIFPVIQKVQSSKRAILQFFAEVPKKRIEAILKECDKFYKKQQNFSNRNTDALIKDESIREGKTKGAGHDTLPGIRTFGTRGTITRKEGRPDQKHVAAVTKEITEETQEEETFKEERKKKFMAYTAGIGLIFLVFLAAIMAIAGYQSGIFALQVYRGRLIDDNFEFVGMLQERWYYIVSTMVMFMSSTTTYRIMDPLTGKPLFKTYTDKVEELEDQLNKAIVQYPRNQRTTSTILKSFIEGGFCANAYQLKVDLPEKISIEWCRGIKKGMLKHGMRSFIFYLIADLKARFLKLTSGELLEENNELLENKLALEYILVPALDFAVQRSAEARYKLVEDSVVELILHYIALLLVMLVMLWVLIRHFANKLNTELWNAKGIITLLPLDLIEKNKNIRNLFSQQMNVIF